MTGAADDDPPSFAGHAAAAHGAAPAHGAGLARHRRPFRTGGRRIALAAGALVIAAGAVAATTTTATGESGEPSGVSMPTTDGGGWNRVFSEDFTDTTGTAGFESDYADRFSVYHGFSDTAGTGRYQASTLSAHDGMLDMHLRTTAGGTPLAGGIVPLVDGEWGGQTSGRYSIRMKSDEVDGYGVAVLLWSDENVWEDGEVDFPEGALGAPAYLNVHCLDDPAEKCLQYETEASFADWHTYTIEWTPSRMSFLVDDELVSTTTESIPTSRMHLVVQAGSNGGHPPRGAAGSLLVDWMTIDVPVDGAEPQATLPSDGATAPAEGSWTADSPPPDDGPQD
ncbi:glycoside hydrolase family 16 protein [Curtobacterium sp. MCPF17_002]|uniref:glycoside hydrolase family 16 protein n=1 Tax=Curtobacterium sp. MCPF17_002 TaxID=2175645 RepID=UPI000DA98D04|nr:glycoside hydrolase family 16 protein [Curtobacterium sp. MCPF17_002]WIB76273.1 glycoside hydrolase family 16 protein [Curtobacterium sp. MCPF17_002]